MCIEDNEAHILSPKVLLFHVCFSSQYWGGGACPNGFSFFLSNINSFYDVYECLPTCISVYYARACYPEKPKEGVESSGVTDSCELWCGYWGLKPSTLEKRPVYLTTELLFSPLTGLIILIYSLLTIFKMP